MLVPKGLDIVLAVSEGHSVADEKEMFEELGRD